MKVFLINTISDLAKTPIIFEIIFKDYRDPFRAFNIHMSIICDLEQGGKITEEEAFTQIKEIW